MGVVRPNPEALETRLEVASRARPHSWDSVWPEFASLGTALEDLFQVASRAQSVWMSGSLRGGPLIMRALNTCR